MRDRELSTIVRARGGEVEREIRQRERQSRAS